MKTEVFIQKQKVIKPQSLLKQRKKLLQEELQAT